jgi:hypothetical protein
MLYKQGAIAALPQNPAGEGHGWEAGLIEPRARSFGDVRDALALRALLAAERIRSRPPHGMAVVYLDGTQFLTQVPSPPSRSFWQVGSKSVAVLRGKIPRAVRRYALLSFFTFEVVCLTFLQKVAVPLDFEQFGLSMNLGAVEVAIPLTYLALAVLFVFAPPKVDLNRLILFTIFVLLSLTSVALVRNYFSPASIILVLVINGPFILYIDVSESVYRRMLKVYLNLMVFFGGIVLLQHAMQLLWTWRSWPNLDRLLPAVLQFTGYVYIQPLFYGSSLMKPNGFFFLEVSYISQWTAVALALELVYFRRLWRLVFYTVILLASFAGTGLLLLALCAPVLLTRMSWKSLLGVIAVVGAGILFAVQINWFGTVYHRFGEYKQTNSSANHRFIEPFDVLVEVIHHENVMFTGEGPGNIPKGENRIWWASTKLVYEYGIASAISFMAFFAYMLFYKAPSQRIALVLFVMFNLMGGFNIPVYPLLIFLIGGLFRVKEGGSSKDSSGKARRRKGTRSASLNSPWRPASSESSKRVSPSSEPPSMAQ